MTLVGIDVSSYQPANITAIVPGDFAIVKATEGVDYVSSTCVAQMQGAFATGKRAGFYHFISTDDPIRQADFFCAQTAGFFWRAVPFLDWEGPGMALGAPGARAFVDRVRSNMGVLPPIYMSLSPAMQDQYRALVDAGLWVAYGANYDTPQGYEGAPASSSSGVWPFAAMRQFTSAGQLPGYSGRLDLDVFYGDGPAWDAYAGGSTPQPQPLEDDVALIQAIDRPGQPVYLFAPGYVKHLATLDQVSAAQYTTRLGTPNQSHDQEFQDSIYNYGLEEYTVDQVLEIATTRNPDGTVKDYNRGGMLIASWNDIRKTAQPTLGADQIASMSTAVVQGVLAGLPAGTTPDQLEAAVKAGLTGLTLTAA